VKLAGAFERDEGLVQNPIQVRLAGPLGNLVFPALCPNCGMAAQKKIEVARVFMRTGGTDRLRRFEIARVDVPFCPPCLARHHSELEPLTASQRLRSLLRSELSWPGIGLAALGLFLTGQTSSTILESPAASWPLAALLVFLFGGAWLALNAAWVNGERYRIPAPTFILSSFDFSDDLSNDFGTQARTYSLRNEQFAEALADLNKQASNELLGPRHKARKNTNFIIGLVLLAVIVAWQVLNGAG
jgi:hypothetical protein